jgi:zinc protease
MRAPSTGLEKVVRKGVEPKSQTMVFFAGESEFSPGSRHALRSLAELLEMKLLETLREALGGTYSVSVNGETNRYPRPEYSITVAFGSAPERADSLYRAVLDEIERIKTQGVTDADVQKVREQQLRAHEVSEKENGFWLANLSARLENGEDPSGLLNYRDLILGLTGDQIRDAARKYLDTSRAIRFVLLPEKPAS